MAPTSKSRRAQWLLRTKSLPASPGVYLMKDAEGAVIYVGKAKDLRARVRSYFQEGTSDYRAFVGILAGILADLETVVAQNEKEALLLERELIRRHEPRFNVIWRDDKQYLCLRVDTSHEYPWVEVVRNMGKDGARYFGPFHSASAARQTLRVVNRHFQLRTCRDSVLYHRSRPCLEYQIGRCLAPCVLEIDREKYRESVSDVVMFLEGKGEELVTRLEARMWSASERMEYEAASHYRNQLRAVEKSLVKQQVALPSLLDSDVIGLYREGADLCVAVLEVRGGRVQNVLTQLSTSEAMSDSDLIESFLIQRYEIGGSSEQDHDRAVNPPPEEILVPVEIEGAPLLAEILGDERGKKVEIKTHVRGDRAALLRMAQDNAEHAFFEKRRKTGAIDRMLEALKSRLRLARVPRRIECFDISNLGGQLIVGSCAAFLEGEPNKSAYRRYRVKSAKGQDDFASMYEVLLRRLRRGRDDGSLPDLVVIDGGKGQLNVACAALHDLEITGVDVVSLAKSHVLGTDEMDASVRSPERVFVPGAKEPIILSQTSAELLFLTRVRDEAHRFAITFQKDLRGRARLRSALEDIPGIGPGRRRALLKHLGSLKRVREATVEEIAKVPGVGQTVAACVHAVLHPTQDARVPPRESLLEPSFGETPEDSSKESS